MHFVRPLPEIFTVFGKSISIFEAVVPSMLFLTKVVTLAALGFFFVPAFVGETVVVAVTSAVWADGHGGQRDGGERGDRRDQELTQRVSSSGDGELRNCRDRAEGPGLPGAYPTEIETPPPPKSFGSC